MPTPTYTPLANITLTSANAAVTFSSISQAYTDLVLIAQAVGGTGHVMITQFNGDASSIYSRVLVKGDSSGVASSNLYSRSYWDWHQVNPIDFSSIKLNVMNYSSTNQHKTIIGTLVNSDVEILTQIGKYGSTNAVTSILTYNTGGNFPIGSIFTLYGIVA